mmetsp:Transcript_49042/g.88669  ORF Transcript_49042/g.88669 Transcript_49042/m.88669 type:complete len:324 (+) Transcript_49042:47-1018(+)
MCVGCQGHKGFARSTCLVASIFACVAYSGQGDALSAVPASDVSTDVEKLGSSSQVVAHDSKSLATLLLAFNPLRAAREASGYGCRAASIRRAQPVAIQSRAPALRMLQRAADKEEGKSKKRRSDSTITMDAALELEQDEVQVLQLPEISRESLANAFKGYVEDITSWGVLLSTLIAGAGNTMTQVLSNGGHIMDIDFIATLSVMLFVQLYSGGIQPKIYGAIDRRFGDDNLKKMAVDFFLYAPFVFLPLFYMTTGPLRGLDWSATVSRFSNMYLDSYLAQLLVWPIPMFIYWRWIPERFGVIYIQGFAFIDKALQAFIEQSHH